MATIDKLNIPGVDPAVKVDGDAVMDSARAAMDEVFPDSPGTLSDFANQTLGMILRALNETPPPRKN